MSGVQQAELYLQSIHTRSNLLPRNTQIRDLVALAQHIVAGKSSEAACVSDKSDMVLNSVLEMSEHLQNEEHTASLRLAQQSENCHASHQHRGLGNRGSQAHRPSADRSVPPLGGGGGASEALYTADESGLQHQPGKPNHEEIGDIDWETMQATNISFADVVGCAQAIDAIKESVLIPMRFPSLFKRLNVKRSNGIMLYGPPGTGKSMIARATASEVSAAFYNASCADLTSRWVGGSEKKLQSLFATALRNSPCIIFFDEVDSIACKRDADGSIADQRLTNQLLIELDKIFIAQNEVFVIAATNLPWQIDLAVMRRFPHTVYIDLPDTAGRSVMFRSFFGPNVCSDQHIQELAAMSKHMSGSDIANVVNDILFEPIRILCRTTHFHFATTTTTPAATPAATTETTLPDDVHTPPTPQLAQTLAQHNSPHHTNSSSSSSSGSIDAGGAGLIELPSSRYETIRISVASATQVRMYSENTPAQPSSSEHAVHVPPASPSGLAGGALPAAHELAGKEIVLQRTLSELVAEYGESCICMPAIEFENIRTKVAAFRHTVSHDYLQRYVEFHKQHT